MQVHDELLVETAEDEVETVKQIMLDGMKNAVSLKVPLEVDLKEGKDWLEAALVCSLQQASQSHSSYTRLVH